jgi:hypothetical protein
VSEELHALSAYSWGENTWYPLSRRLEGPTACSGNMEKRKFSKYVGCNYNCTEFQDNCIRWFY